MGFSKQAYWTGLPLPPPRDLPNPGIELKSPALQVDSLPTEREAHESRSMNQGRLEVVKQVMVRVNINILGISELKWTGMGEFNSDGHYIYCCGKESLRRNGVALIANERVPNAVLTCNLKNDRTICF